MVRRSGGMSAAEQAALFRSLAARIEDGSIEGLSLSLRADAIGDDLHRLHIDYDAAIIRLWDTFAEEGWTGQAPAQLTARPQLPEGGRG